MTPDSHSKERDEQRTVGFDGKRILASKEWDKWDEEAANMVADLEETARPAMWREAIAIRLRSQAYEHKREMEELGTIEIAVRNPNVRSYMDHWEGRATKAEAENKRLLTAVREAIEDQDEIAALQIIKTALKGASQ